MIGRKWIAVGVIGMTTLMAAGPSAHPQIERPPLPPQPPPVAQIDRRAPATPTVAPLFMSRGVDVGPAFFVECRNTRSAAVSSGAPSWALTDSAIRVDGSILAEPPGGRIGPGLTTDIPPGGIWRGIIELRQSPRGTGWPVASGANARMSVFEPLRSGRHAMAVRCAGVWSDDVMFYWER